VPLNKHCFAIISVPPLSQTAQDEFEALPLDPYCGGEHRYRRFGQFRMEHDGQSWRLKQLPLRPFIQSKDYTIGTSAVSRGISPPLQIDPQPQYGGDVCGIRREDRIPQPTARYVCVKRGTGARHEVVCARDRK